jgi:hypothetical protein
MTPVEEYRNIAAETFRAEVAGRNRPAILRGLVDHWPLVVEGRRSPEAAVACLERFNDAALVSTVTAAPAERGRLFYREDRPGLNFNLSLEKLSSVLKGLLKQLDAQEPPAIAMQAVSARDHLPGFEEEHRIDLVTPGTPARLWIGNAVTVAPHFDASDNIACVAAGRRRFVLFPPEQVANLYPGPFDVTPGGVPVGMVPLDEPDLERFPRYCQALGAAQVAELEPGDALYIPYMWWHGVKSLGGFNILVNYWWNEDPVAAAQPYGALLRASYELFRDMSPQHREVWRAMYDYYVFGRHDDPMEHLPPQHRDAGLEIGPEAIARFKAAIAELVSPPGDDQA